MQNAPLQSDPAAAPFTQAVLACVAHGPASARVLAAAACLARAAQLPWHAVLVETARSRRLGEAARLRTLAQLREAQAGGAVTSVLEGEDVAAAIAGYARRHGCATVVLAREEGPALPWRQSLARRLVASLPWLDLVEVAPGPRERHEAPAPNGDFTARPSARAVLAGGGASLLTAALALPLLPLLDLANVAMLFLLAVVLVAIRLGRASAVAATLVAFCALVLAAHPADARDYRLGESRYAVALAVMLAVGWIAARLTADLREQAAGAVRRETRTRSLYEFARALSVALQVEQVFEITLRFAGRSFEAKGAILLPDGGGRLLAPAPGAAAPVLSVLDMAAAQWAYDHASAAGAGTSTLPGNQYVYLPLVAPMRTRGVLVLRVPEQGALLVPEQRALLDAFAALAAIALERVHYVEVAQDTEVRMEGERLRNSLLAALSHDLRTPLTGLVGLSESLTLARPALPPAQMELASALRDEARRMSTLVSNLLDMARIQSGGVRLNLQWQLAEELVGSALRACRWQLGGRRIETRLAPSLPLVRFDAALLERVLCNLLENAGKYTPPDARIVIEADVDAADGADAADTAAGVLRIRVRDDGPGLPPGREDALFDKFVRGQQESPIAGVGLGLAICRAIVDAHGGGMRAFNLDGGACFELSLPLGEPPPMPAADLTDVHET